MKRTLLAILLCSQSLWADPLSTSFQRLDWPGAHPSVSQRAQILDQAESSFRQQHDAAGLVQVECLRLEPLLNAYDPSCPERMKKLEKAAAGLAAGPARAQYYWVWSVYAGLRQDDKSRDEFQKLAFAEPGVAAVEKARWLTRIVEDPDIAKTKHQWLEAERRQLASADSSAELRYLMLVLQQRAAWDAGDIELAYSIGLSRVDLAAREHWAWEEGASYVCLQAWCPKMGAGAEAFWKLAWTLAQQDKNDAMRMRCLEMAPNLELYKSGVSQLHKPLPDHVVRDLFLKSRVRNMTDRETVLREYSREVDYQHARQNLEAEIWARRQLGREYRANQRGAESVQQLQAAYDLSRQQAEATGGWVSKRTRPFELANDLAESLRALRREHQQSELHDSLVKAGHTLLPEEELQVRRRRMFDFIALGDERSMTGEWEKLLALADSLPPQLQTNLLTTLLGTIPSAQATRKAELLKRAKECAERDLKDAWKWTQRSSATSALLTCLELERDQVGAKLLLQQSLDAAPSESERFQTGRMLLSVYERNGQVEEYKQLVNRLLKETGPRNRSDLLISASRFLSRKKDLQALAWVEELLRLSSQPGAAPRNYALRVHSDVMFEFGRFQAALDDLDALDPSKPSQFDAIVPVAVTYQSGRLGIALSKARVLCSLGRKADACAVLKREFVSQLNSGDPQTVARSYGELIRIQNQLGQDWQSELEAVCRRYQSMGEPGEVALSEVVYEWLNQLVTLEQWDKGRELLTKYPWKLGASHYKTKNLRLREQWRDLLPSEEKAVRQPGQVGASPKGAQSVRELVDQLRLNQPQLGELLSLRSTNLKYLQERLGPKETLVTYCSDGDQFYTIALRNKTSFFKRSQVSSRDLESLRAKYLKALNSDKPSDSEASLFSTLLEPVLTEDSSQRILVVPTGTLWQLPFGALRDPKGRAAASRSDIVLLTSGDLLRLADNSWSPYRLSQPLAIGAPPAADLPGAFRELGDVAGVLPNCELRRGDQATMASLYDSSRHWGLVHFASHANYHQDRPLESDIQLHDGGLKIRQLSQLALAEHAMVTLSVCQGGDSAGQRLSEPVSLATGFSASGAETVVANLWPVEDEVARIFFGEFYKQLGRGDSPMKSFRQAQDKVRAKFPKPEDWAGFFLMGNPT